MPRQVPFIDLEVEIQNEQIRCDREELNKKKWDKNTRFSLRVVVHIQSQQKTVDVTPLSGRQTFYSFRTGL